MPKSTNNFIKTHAKSIATTYLEVTALKPTDFKTS